MTSSGLEMPPVAVLHGSVGRAHSPLPRSGSCDADGLRASQLQHAVQRMDGNLHLGRPTLVRAAAQPVTNHLFPGHGLDKGGEKALGLALILLREELRSPAQRARAISAMPISQPRQETPSGDGGVDDAAAQDSLAVQSGGGLRAATGRADGAEGRLPASPAAAVAPGSPHPTNAAERGGA